MINNEVAEILEKIANYLEIQGVAWKPEAYRRAAMNIRSFSDDLKVTYEKEGLDGLKRLPSIGEHIAGKIEEFIKTGKIKKLDSLRKEIPINLDELEGIEGLGPKKIKVLYKKLGIKNLKDLEAAISNQKIRKLEGFGQKTEENLIKSIDFRKSSGSRKLLSYALPLAEKTVDVLKSQGLVDKCLIAGSIARKKETIGDMDILITSKKPDAALKLFSQSKEISRVVSIGPTKVRVVIGDMELDVRALKPEEFYSATQYFVGSKEHNVELRKIAIRKGFKLSEYGLFKGDKRVPLSNESDIYKTLGMDWMPYELRENEGEIQAAQEHRLPKLIESTEIKGDLHMHTNYSDGTSPIEEMVKRCQAMGYRYCCITDHFGKLAIAGAMSREKVLKQRKEIDRLNDKIKGFTILHGCETDINSDGKLSGEMSVFKNFDIVIAGIHDAMKQDKKVQTERIIAAMENKYVNIIAHPTGRIINERKGYDLDIEKVFSASTKNNVALELNSFPNRLDLSSVNTRAAIDKGVMISIGTDSHSSEQLSNMRYGVFMARRGWCEKKNVLNTLNVNELLRKIKR